MGSKETEWRQCEVILSLWRFYGILVWRLLGASIEKTLTFCGKISLEIVGVRWRKQGKSSYQTTSILISK